MFIDTVLAILMVIAIFKGFTKGLIVAVFSLLAFFVGLAAAVKLSAVMAGYIGAAVSVSEKWLPFISFIIIFLGFVILVRIGARILEKTVQIAMLGWLNRLGGIFFYSLIYIIIYSTILFYAVQLHVLKPEIILNSVSYDYIAPIGPWVMERLGNVIPLFNNMFDSLNIFFDGISDNIPEP
ncbi:MAG: CvpA family protein [Chitinophagaceae bacterium]|nr:CvpA family protein [Chitinophagaceae bacterium]